MSEPSESLSRPKKSRVEWVLLLLPSALLLLAVGLGMLKAVIAGMNKPDISVTMTATNIGVETIKKQPYAEIRELPGRLLADREVVVSSEILGRIASWEVPEGGKVETGKPIAKETDNMKRTRVRIPLCLTCRPAPFF